jgi:16S rRNA (guanine527-N7)-methyltransferase
MNQPFLINNPTGAILVGSKILGIEVKPESAAKMVLHLEMLLEWNRKINLTALKNSQDIVILHFLDSLTVFRVIPRGLPLSILDVGSGAGFPGVVIRTAEEAFNVTLLDRDPKRIVFLKYVATALGLQGTRFLNSSYKSLITDQNPPSYDILVSRAFSSSPELLDSLHSLLKPHGMLVRMAGPASVNKDFHLEHFVYEKHWEGTLPFSSHFRIVTLYRKID